MLQNIVKWISTVAMVTPLLCAADLGSYRNFQLGMNLTAVQKQAEMKPSEVKVIHQRPALIQDLEWRPLRFPGPSPESDPVKDVLFSFYDGQLFRMVVNYDRYRTEGMTTQDMVDAISKIYGPAAQTSEEIIF